MSIRFRTLFEVSSLIGQGIVERRSRARAAQDWLWILEDSRRPLNSRNLATGSYNTGTCRKLEGNGSLVGGCKRGKDTLEASQLSSLLLSIRIDCNWS